MRSRYSAFVAGDVDWIMDSHHPDTVSEIDREEVETWSKQSDWLGLTIRETTDGGAEDEEGIVDFRARYRLNGQEVNHVERARFLRADGDWRFHSVAAEEEVESIELTPVTPKSTVGRNDPCPCGSGKKFKKCCGAVA